MMREDLFAFPLIEGDRMSEDRRAVPRRQRMNRLFFCPEGSFRLASSYPSFGSIPSNR